VFAIDIMFIVDDILLFPARGIFWIFRELHNAVQAEIENEAETITSQLSELYMELETGRITTSEFDAREKKLLDRLDEIEARGIPIEDEP
jgi:hypothetical protein